MRQSGSHLGRQKFEPTHPRLRVAGVWAQAFCDTHAGSSSHGCRDFRGSNEAAILASWNRPHPARSNGMNDEPNMISRRDFTALTMAASLTAAAGGARGAATEGGDSGGRA